MSGSECSTSFIIGLVHTLSHLKRINISKRAIKILIPETEPADLSPPKNEIDLYSRERLERRCFLPLVFVVRMGAPRVIHGTREAVIYHGRRAHTARSPRSTGRCQ